MLIWTLVAVGFSILSLVISAWRHRDAARILAEARALSDGAEITLALAQRQIDRQERRVGPCSTN